MSLLTEEQPYVNPAQLTYVCSDANGAQQQQTAASVNSAPQLQQQVLAAANPVATQQQQAASVAASQAQQVACNPAALAAANKATTGAATATKLVYISGLFKKGDLAKTGVQMTFNAAELQALFQVHARDADDRSVRRGDVQEVAVNEISVLQTFNGGDLPIQLGGTGAMQGKTYALTYKTGRPGGKGCKLLWVLNPGGHHHHKPVVIYRRVKDELMHMARIVGSFDMKTATSGMTPLDNNYVLVANHSFMSAFILRQSAKWNVPWNSFEQVRGSYRLMPKSLTDFAIQTLNDMQSHLQRNKHDLSQLGFTCSAVCAKGSMVGDYVSDDSDVLIGMYLLIKYTFLRPDKLKAEYSF